MSNFHAGIDGHVVIPGTHTAAGGTTSFNFHYPPSQDRPARPCEPFSTVPFAPDPDFVDRPEILTWLRSKCAAPGARAALVGLGGVGKSQLAIQHAHNVRDTAPHTFVFWVHASTRARFEEAYRGIADRLELPGRDRPEANVSRLVCNWLQDEANGTWLMILDNADFADVFYPKQEPANDRSGSASTSLANYVPQSRNGSVLITSRNKDVAARLAGGHRHIKEVFEISEEQALQLLRNKLCDGLSSEGASELLRTLGYLPLAITQAAAYINRHAPRVTIQDYLDEFSKSTKSKESLLNWDGGDLRRGNSVSNSVVTTWQLTFECMRKERPSAADLLSLMSLFNPQAIPEFAFRSYNKGAEEMNSMLGDVFSMLQNLMHRHRSDGKETFHDDVAVLQAYSLVSATAEKGVLKMHPLVQYCTMFWLSSTKKEVLWKLIFIKLMRRELLSKKLGNWEECKQLVPHIDTFYPGEAGNKSFDRWVSLTIDVGNSFYEKGKYHEAAILFRRALKAREDELGKQHPDTLLSVNNLANALLSQGQYDEAERLYRRALEGYEKELGKQHPNTLLSINNLAIVLQRQGQYNEAERLNRRVLGWREKELGKQHPDTLISVNNLAHVLQDQGQYDEAERLNRRALEWRERELGKQHPDTLSSVNNLANALLSQGQYDEAKRLHQRALEGCEEELGKQHPSTLLSVNNLANVLQRQGQYNEAERLYRRALERREKGLGLEHPHTLQSVHCLAELLVEQNMFDAAETLYRRALEGREKKLGPQHPDTLFSVSGLAYALHQQKRYEDAGRLYQQACDGLTQRLGSQHPKTIKCLDRFSAMQQELDTSKFEA